MAITDIALESLAINTNMALVRSFAKSNRIISPAPVYTVKSL